MYVCSLASSSYVFTHLLIQRGHHCVACIISKESSTCYWYWCTSGVAYAQNKHFIALLACLLGSLHSTTLMVFAISDYDYSLTYILLLGETVCSQIDSLTYIGALSLNQRWLYILQKHLGWYIVTGDWQLHIGIASKDYQSYLILCEVVNHILYQHLTLLQSAWCHIGSKHGIRDIKTYQCLYAVTFLMTYLGAHLRTCNGYYDKSDGQLYQQELSPSATSRCIRHQGIDELFVAQSLYILSASPFCPRHHEHHNGYYGEQV